MSPRLVPDACRPGRRGGENLSWKRRTLCAAFFVGLILVAEPGGNGAEAGREPGAAKESVTVPFDLRRGHVMVSTEINGTNKLSMLLDTGYSMTMLSLGYVAAADLKQSGRSITIVGIAGEEQASVYEGPEFGFGGWSWRPRRIGAFPEVRSSRSRRRDGILGAGFFRRFVVEIDSVRKMLVLHEPGTYKAPVDGEILPLSFKSTTPTVEATVALPGGEEIQAMFEIDTGCDGALCIGKHFVEAHRLAEGPGADGGRVGVGGRTPIREGRLPQMRLGRLAIQHPEANFFLDGSPVDAPLAGHIGWELLRQFHVTFDYSRKQMILRRTE